MKNKDIKNKRHIIENLELKDRMRLGYSIIFSLLFGFLIGILL